MPSKKVRETSREGNEPSIYTHDDVLIFRMERASLSRTLLYLRMSRSQGFTRTFEISQPAVRSCAVLSQMQVHDGLG